MTAVAGLVREVLGHAPSLREATALPAVVDAIVIVGSTCTGKTTLVGQLRRAAIPGVEIPQRFVTRAPRADDVAAEAHHVTPEWLDAEIAAGRIAVHWTRVLADRRERYAFARPRSGAFPIYSANNAIYEPGNVRPPDALARALLVGVVAPDDVRDERLHARSPALFADHPAEARDRLADRADAVARHVHVVVDNHGALQDAAKRDIVALVRAVTSSAERRP